MPSREPLSESNRPRQPAKECTNEGRAHFYRKVMDKRYEKALERARQGLPIDKIFPELYESEDERMINELQGFLASFGADYFGTGEWQKFDDWLEMKKEQQPAEWSEEDENWSKYLLDELYAGLEDYCGAAEKDMKEAIKWFKTRLKSLRPQPHWKPSEEQMEALMLAIEGKCAPTSYMSRRLEDLYEALANEFHVECKLDK